MMKPASFRNQFLETLQEVTDLARGEIECERALWDVEYIGRRNTSYHFNGSIHDGERSNTGHSFDARRGTIAQIDGNMLTFALLDFQENAVIAAYAGQDANAVQIAESVRLANAMSEVVYVAIRQEHKTDIGGETQTMTCFIFVGFEQACDADDVGPGLGLASSIDFISPHWSRHRTTLITTPPQKTTIFGA
jgi:hypothetical protein